MGSISYILINKMRDVLTIISAITILLNLKIVTAEDCKGCVPLDSYSFDKVISKFKAVAVKFDVAFPYGDKHEEFGKVAADTKDSPDILISEVGVKDFGNKDNADLAERYNVKKDDYPAVLLFLEGKKEPIRFETGKDEDFTADNIKRFIRMKSGVYLGLPGCIEKMDELAEEFKLADGNVRKEILNRAKKLEESLSEEQKTSAGVYIKMMERILDRGDDFVKTEEKRIQGLLKGKLSDVKKRSMEDRRNILQSFSHKDEL